MKVKLRGKIWKQITKEKYVDLILENKNTARFIDNYDGEITYFKEIEKLGEENGLE